MTVTDAQAIRARLATLGVPQHALAAALGVSQATLSLWLNGYREPPAEFEAEAAEALDVAVEGAWSWDVEECPAPERVWRFRRYGVDLGVRFGRALGVVRPWLDVGAVIGSGSHYPARPALVAAAEPVFDAGYPAVDE